jgi:hypothetical protein
VNEYNILTNFLFFVKIVCRIGEGGPYGGYGAE